MTRSITESFPVYTLWYFVLSLAVNLGPNISVMILTGKKRELENSQFRWRSLLNNQSVGHHILDAQ